MCFSEQASFIVFFVGIVGSALCVSLGTITDKIIGYYFIFIALIQGIEFLIWRHQKCDKYNQVLTLMGMTFNHLQPIVLATIITLLNKKIRDYPYFLLSIIIYICAIVPYSWQFIQKPENQCTLTNKINGHLQWNWNSLQYYFVVYAIYVSTTAILFFTGIPSQKIGIYMAFLTIISYIITGKIYWQGPNKFTTVGSMWCFFSVFVPIFYYGLRKTGSITL